MESFYKIYNQVSKIYTALSKKVMHSNIFVILPESFYHFEARISAPD